MSEPVWTPVNDIERALVEAAAQDDRQGYFQLISIADLFLPQVTGDPTGQQRFFTVRFFEQTFLPVFTSVPALLGQFGGVATGYTVTNYSELARKWPNPDWRLAVNPGTPVDAYLGVEALAAAAMGDDRVPLLAETIAAAAADDKIEQELQATRAAADHPADPAAAMVAASRAGDAYGYLELLLDTLVLIPTSRPVEADEILEDGFPWRPAAGAVIEVFTTPEAYARTYPEPVPVVEVMMPFALAMWPPAHGMSVNPGGADALELQPEQVALLLTF